MGLIPPRTLPGTRGEPSASGAQPLQLPPRPPSSLAHELPSAVCLGFLPTQSDSHYDFGGFCEHHKHVSYLRCEPLAPDPILWDEGRGDIAAPREAETRSPGEGVPRAPEAPPALRKTSDVLRAMTTFSSTVDFRSLSPAGLFLGQRGHMTPGAEEAG